MAYAKVKFTKSTSLQSMV